MFLNFQFLLTICVICNAANKDVLEAKLGSTDKQVFSLRQLLQSGETIRMTQQDGEEEAVRLTSSQCDPNEVDCRQQYSASSDTTSIDSSSSSTPPATSTPTPMPTPSASVSVVPQKCEDIPPDGPFTCKYYADEGLCDRLSQELCAESCGTCGCEDVQINEFITCDDIVGDGRCGEVEPDGYCLKSCGGCGPGGKKPKGKGFLQEATALLKYKSSLNDQTSLASWVGEDACAGWEGITCNDKDRVEDINLGDVNWKEFPDGRYAVDPKEPLVTQEQEIQIPQEWTIMKDLAFLQLRNTGIAGSLPKWLTKLKELKVLDLNQNYITGILPPEYSVWTQIAVITVKRNQIYGTLPPEYSELTTLQWIEFSENSLSGQTPEEYSVLSPQSVQIFPQDGNLCTSLSGVWEQSDSIC